MEQQDEVQVQMEIVLSKFKNKKQSNYDYYNKKKNSDEFKIKNRLNAKLYYTKNKEYINIKNLYNYYLKNDKLNIFKERHKDKYNILFF
tara:strand:- start:108 stop:374 length:267 start_codon:yes stop_codon:yes gene_type:complete